jgi:MFS family permease
VLAGFRVIARIRDLRLVVAAGMASPVGIGIVDVASYPLAVELGSGSEGFGAMTALLGGGGILGAALAGRVLAAGPLRVLAWAFAIGAAGLALAAVAPVLVLALAGMAISGAGRGLGDVASTTVLQARSDDEVRSRIFAAQEGAAHLAFTLSALAGGLVVGLIGARGAFAVAAGCVAAAVPIALRVR